MSKNKDIEVFMIKKLMGLLAIGLFFLGSSRAMESIVVGSSWSGKSFPNMQSSFINMKEAAQENLRVCAVLLGDDSKTMKKFKKKIEDLIKESVWRKRLDKVKVLEDIFSLYEQDGLYNAHVFCTITVIDHGMAWFAYAGKAWAAVGLDHGWLNSSDENFIVISRQPVRVDEHVEFIILAQGTDRDVFTPKDFVKIIRKSMFKGGVDQIGANDMTKMLVEAVGCCCAFMIIFFNRGQQEEKLYVDDMQPEDDQIKSIQDKHEVEIEQLLQEHQQVRERFEQCMGRLRMQDADDVVQVKRTVDQIQEEIESDVAVFERIQDVGDADCRVVRGLMRNAETRHDLLTGLLSDFSVVGQ